MRLARERIALTIARRTSVRARGRSILIAAMVALPIAGMAGAALVATSMSPTAAERITTELGNTQAQLRIVSPPNSSLVQTPNGLTFNWGNTDGSVSDEPTEQPASLFAPGTRILPILETSVSATTATGIGTFTAFEGPSWDPSFAGKSVVTAGRTPQADNEVMVTAATLPRLGVKLGDTVELDAPDPVTVTVVGVLDYRPAATSEQIFFGRTGALSDMTADDRLQASAYYLPDTVLDWAAVQKLNGEGAVVLSRSVLLNPPPANEVKVQNSIDGSFVGILALAGIFGGFAAFEVILLAGAAFTVTARQQQRTLATIASVGATRSTLFRILSASGLVLGAIGGVVGVALGIGAGAAFMALTDNGSSTQYYGFHLPWLLMLAIVAFALLIGWVSALMPARNASRFDIVSALRGSRRPPTSGRRRPITGLILLGLGVGITLAGGLLLLALLDAGQGIPGGHPLLWVPIAMLIVGPVLAQLGLILCAPLVLRVIARLMGRSRVGARLASQDAARNPGRSVPALAAIMTTVFVAVFAMAMLSSSEVNSRAHYQYGAVLGAVRASLSYQDWSSTGPGETKHYEHPHAVIEAIRSTLPVKDVRILSSVAEPQEVFSPTPEQKLSAAAAAKDYAVPVVPPQNLCPFSPGSPDFNEQTLNDPASAEAKAARADPRCDSSYAASSFGLPHIWVGDAGDLAMVLGRAPSSAAKHTLADGGAVSLYPDYLSGHTLSISWWSAAQLADKARGTTVKAPVRTNVLDAVLDAPEHPLYFGVFVSSTTADAIGLDYEESLVMASTATMPTTAQSDALTQAMASLPDNRRGEIYAQIERGPQPFATVWVWGLVGLSALIAVAAAAVAIGLARFDGRQDDATLSSLGAGRRIRRDFAFWQALVITGAGAVLGAAMGLVPALALSANADMPFAPPWLQVAVIAVALPLVIALGNWLFTRTSRVSARRVTIA
jgi:putative ABC transport system permease protein